MSMIISCRALEESSTGIPGKIPKQSSDGSKTAFEGKFQIFKNREVFHIRFLWVEDSLKKTTKQRLKELIDTTLDPLRNF